MKKRPREPKPILPALASAAGPALIKHLASCNTTVRSQSLRLLQTWLASEPDNLSDSDIKKLWKGLFYCLWHADKSPNQLALINRLTSLFLSLQSSISLEFFRGFLVTLRREWPGIDRLRLDKFYLLIRRFVRALFELMRLRKWDVGVLGEYLGVLEKDGFLADDKLRGNGVNYHIVSVFLEELKGVGFPVREEVVEAVLKPFFAVMERGKDKILLGKVRSYVFDELVKMGKELMEKKRVGADFDGNDGDVLLGLVALKMRFSGKFYEVGSGVDCIQGNRKVVLALHEEFLKLEKELESLGIEIAIPEYDDGGDGGSAGGGDDHDEVPQLIPIDFGAEYVKDKDQSDTRMSKKKNKKAKKGTDGGDKKSKKKNKKRKDEDGVPQIEANGGSIHINGTEDLDLHSPGASGNISLSEEMETDGAEVDLNETVIMNLQKQFEKVAAEMGSDSDDDDDDFDTPLISAKKSKRKKAKLSVEQDNTVEDGFDASATKSAKKVRFSMKNNLVWKPQTPLPPESLRLPPSVTPRGSALKKGVPPGPVIETPPSKKKAKLKKKKKAQNKLKSATPVMKRRKKIQTRSA